MEGISQESGFWDAIDLLVSNSRVVIDRPRGSHHPRYSGIIYPLDYGYLEDTRSMDGHGIDVWQGSAVSGVVQAVICTIDIMKRDSEIKLIIGCTPDEVQRVLNFHTQGDYMRGILIERK